MLGRLFSISIASLVLAGCADEAPPPEPPVRTCLPGPGATGSPRSIQEAVELINSLEMPVTAECFAETLDRPLQLEASESIFSAQPAEGDQNPRIFIFYEPLILSIVTSGPGRNLVEFGELVSDKRSVKGEIEFPVTEPLDASAPHTRIVFDEQPEITTCAFCHAMEDPSPTIATGRVSQALRPTEDSLVPVERLVAEQTSCDSSKQADPRRCGYLTAITAHGELIHHPFPDTMDTFFDGPP